MKEDSQDIKTELIDVSPNKQMKKNNRFPSVRYLWMRFKMVCIIVIVAIAIITGTIFYFNITKERIPEITSDLISEHIVGANELSTVKYIYTNMAQFEEEDWYIFSKKSFILSYDGYLKAGVDCSELEIKMSGDTVTITLPPAEIFDNVIDETSLQVFNEKDGLFNAITIEDSNKVLIEEKQKTEDKAIEKGLLIEATEKAKTTITNLIQFIPTKKNQELKIVFINK